MTAEGAFGIFFCVLLFLPAIEDSKTGYISDWKTMLLAAFGCLHWFFFGQMTDLIASGLVFLFFGILFWMFRGAMGSGDVFLAAAISLWLTPPASVVFVWLSFFLGGFSGLLLILFHVKQFRGALSFAPFLCASGGFSYFWGNWLWSEWLLLF